MTQPKSDKILSALSFKKTRTVLFSGHPYTPKHVLPIKVWITFYKPNISPVVCRCEIRLGSCYIYPLNDSEYSLRFVPPSLKRTCGATQISSGMTKFRLVKILSALGLNKACTVLFLRHPYIPKRVLPIKMWITPYKTSISLVLWWCEICLGCYKNNSNR